MISGVSVEAGREAVVLVSERPLRVLSSAVHHGGFVDARAVVNLHVDKNDPCADPAGMIGAFARRAGVPAPWVGLLTGAFTERAAVALEAADDLRALAITASTIGSRRSHTQSRNMLRHASRTAGLGGWLVIHSNIWSSRRSILNPMSSIAAWVFLRR